MRRMALVAVALTVSMAPVTASESAHTYGCAYPGQRGNVLVLVNRPGSSSVKMGGQRVPATHSSDNGEQTWSWSGNAVVLGADGVARYFQGSGRETPTGTFRCKPLG